MILISIETNFGFSGLKLQKFLKYACTYFGFIGFLYGLAACYVQADDLMGPQIFGKKKREKKPQTDSVTVGSANSISKE